MAFDDSMVETLAAPGFVDRMSFDLGRVLQTLVLAAAALLIAFGLLRPMLRRAIAISSCTPVARPPALRLRWVSPERRQRCWS